MIKTFSFLLLFFLLISPFQGVLALQIDWQKMDYPSFQIYFQQKAREYASEYRLPGASLALIHKGEVTLQMGWGVLDLERKGEMTPHTPFPVAYLSKPVTALGVMKLVEAGLISLEDPVHEYLTSWELPESPYSSSMRVYQLLSHTAGLGPAHYLGYPPQHPLPSLKEVLSGDSRGSRGVTVVGEPGQESAYASGGYTVLQILVEEVTRVDFSQYMEETVLEPLGMEKSFYTIPEEGSPGLPTPYSVFLRPLPLYRYAEKAAAGLYSSASDLAHFLAALMPEGGILEKSWQERMFTPVLEDFCLGFAVVETEKGPLLFQESSHSGYQAYLAMMPETGSGLIILTNSDRGKLFCRDMANLYYKYQGIQYRTSSPGILTLYLLHFYQQMVRFLR